MNSSKHILSLFVFFGLLSGCTAPATRVSQPTDQVVAPVATLTPAPSATLAPYPTNTSEPVFTTTPTVVPLTAEAVRNMEISLPVSQKKVKLVNGRYEAGSGTDYLLAVMADPIALKDINGDGLSDAAVVVGENLGGSGVFESLLVIFNQNGVPTQWADAPLGDRVKINSITIQDDRQIVLDMLASGPNDPACCPSLAEKQGYRLTKGGLFLSWLTSKTPTGDERVIKINTPVDFSEAGATIHVQGEISIAPFENTLAYTIQDDSHHTIDQGVVPVEAASAGEPGSFTAAIDLSKTAPSMIIHLNIQEVSPADGAVLAMASVELLRK